MLGERVVVVVFGRSRLELSKALGAAVAVPAVILENALAQGLVGGLLVGLAQRGVDAKPARVDIFRVMLRQSLTHHLGRELRVKRVLIYLSPGS